MKFEKLAELIEERITGEWGGGTQSVRMEMLFEIKMH